MAFYEMLPGAGMPSGLQAGMDSVLNKKFGTSTTYPAEGWPDTVNLMGPLPEKTVSGAIVAFSDGADDVPLKKCEITFPASLDGYSSVDVVATGKNLLENELTTQTLNGTTFTVNADKSITVSGTPSTQTRVYIHSGDFFKVRVPSYFSSGSMPTGTRIFCQKVTSGGTSSYPTISPTSSLNDVGATYKNALLEINTTFDGSAFTIYPMIEIGSSASDYVPYTAPTTHTASLGRTIHGGTADVVNGSGNTKVYKQTYTGDNVGTTSITYGEADEGYTHLYFNIADIPLAYNPTADNVISNITLPWNNNASAAGVPSVGECWRLTNGGSPQKPIIYMYIHQTWASVADFKTWLNANPITVVYEVSDETTFTFDPVPIDSKLGSNTLWSEQGSSAEVTYRADIALALGE